MYVCVRINYIMSHVILTICWVASLFEDTPKKNDKTPGWGV